MTTKSRMEEHEVLDWQVEDIVNFCPRHFQHQSSDDIQSSKLS